MKKSIITLGLILASFATSTFAATTNSPSVVSSASAKPFNNSPLCRAISKGDVATVKKFIEYGADVNETSNGMTPLMVAARYNNVEVMEYLMSKGASMQTKNEQGMTALKYAEASKANEAAAFLREKMKK
jgi:ankyrin repeat protein